ncbi:MAG: InlB B-repeat-containing protein [Eggerthellaceae bacterium]|nr:InlB B-repeat-containing protein [Eggerthellaceae bacterium]
MARSAFFKTPFFLLMAAVLLFGQLTLALSMVASAGEVMPAVKSNGPRLVASAGDSYQWLICDTEDGAYTEIDSATDGYYDIKATDEGKYIKARIDDKETEAVGPIGKLVVFDLTKDFVHFGDDYSGVGLDGSTVEGRHSASNIYVIKQSDKLLTTKNIVFSNTQTASFDVTLDGVNMGQTSYGTSVPNGSKLGEHDPNKASGFIHIPSKAVTTNVVLRLKGENVVRNIHYFTGDNKDSSLKITDVNGDGDWVSSAPDAGKLYVPVKVDGSTSEAAKAAIDDFVVQSTAYNHWNSGIGGDDGTGGVVRGLELAGGRIQVLTTYGDNCSAIGAGGNDYADILISGGEIIAHCSGTGAAIGGGIGWNSAGGRADVKITGGKVYAENHGKIFMKGDTFSDESDYDEVVGGVAIGAGSSFESSGNTSVVNISISGGDVEAYGAFGNGIGGGNSSSAAGGNAAITITGGKVKASSIGGGDSKKGAGGDAEVTIGGTAVVELVKVSGIELSGSIGGGLGGSVKATTGTNDGGTATVTVTDGTLTCADNIGGGAGGTGGNGGAAVINVSGGKLTAKSIGGGQGGTAVDGVGGNGGAAEIYFSQASVDAPTVVRTGSIGGGVAGVGGKLGYATARITGGDISGQFLMAEGGTAPCSFEMTGGTLHDVNTADDSTYHYAQKSGAAVYMDDSKGVVIISGGTIEECSAVNGGAIYMTAGTCSLSGNASISNCSASADGGAVYLGGGTFMLSEDASISSSSAGGDGGAVYLGGGLAKILGGSISGNEAVANGGGVAVANGDYYMSGGAVDGNVARTGNGGGIYVVSHSKNVKVDVLSGSVSGNTSQVDGGALSVVGKAEGTTDIAVTIGLNVTHKDYGADGSSLIHDEKCTADADKAKCPVIKNNVVYGSGGAVYVTGNEKTLLNIYCVDEAGNKEAADGGQSTFMKMEGGKVLISTSESTTTDADQDGDHGNISIAGTMYVVGGQIDIWGTTSNPSITGYKTIDIVKLGDHFIDHRIRDGFYRLVYFENFRDPLTGALTGQYKSLDVKEGDTQTISGVIYSHPGYEINGWNTHEDGDGGPHNYPHGKEESIDSGDARNGWYEVGEIIKFDGNPFGDLTIHADWNPVGYELHFDANPPAGVTVNGTMSVQHLTYDKSEALNANGFSCTGYLFKGWNTEKDGSGTTYGDGATVKNLVSVRGEVAYLYAQWEKCNHDPSKHAFVHSIVEEDAHTERIRRDCPCGAYFETLTLSAADTVYNRVVASFPAQAEYASSEGAAAAGWASAISYAPADASAPAGASAPVNAGDYTASVTVKDVLLGDGSTGDLTAQVFYVVEKAEQDKPEAPVYVADVTADKSELDVRPVAASPLVTLDTGKDGEGNVIPGRAPYDAKAQYRVVYYDGDTRVETDWIDENLVDGFAATFSMNVALTNYYVYARYGGSANYKPSPESQSIGAYFFSGDVEVYVDNGEGIVEPALRWAGSGNPDDPPTGVMFDIVCKPGYYLPNSFPLSMVVKDKDGNVVVGSSTVLTGPDENGACSLTGIQPHSHIYITIPPALKQLSVKAFVEPGEEFGSVDGASARISRDSAYSAYFEVNSYDSNIYGGSATTSEPFLEFSEWVPAGTRVILIDKTSDTWGYYGCTAATERPSFLLSEFERMGSNGELFAAPESGSMKLQFVVDFSAAGAGATGSMASPCLVFQADKTKAANAADVVVAADVYLEDAASFSLSSVATPAASQTTTFELGYTPSAGAASKWDRRSSALVLTPRDEVSLPVDAYLDCTVGSSSFAVYPNAAGAFVVPVADFGASSARMTLESALIGRGDSYAMDAVWVVSQSAAASAPRAGSESFEVGSLGADYAKSSSFTFAADPVRVPSVEVECFQGNDYQRVVASDNVLSATVKWKDVSSGSEMKLTLMREGADGYASTAWESEIAFEDVTPDADGVCSTALRIPLNGAFESGNYCLNVSVMQGLVGVARDRYYFIIE